MQLQAVRKGSRGQDVKILQISLNGSLSPSPQLGVDGFFGQNTERTVVRFQKECQLSQDGVVGPKTWAALNAPSLGKSPSREMQKFTTYLGSERDFILLASRLEAKSKSTGDTLQKLREHFKKVSVKRFMLVTGDDVGVIDFQHLFGAAWESYNSGISRSNHGVGLGGSPGNSMLLGLGNEIVQCVKPSQRHSCFGKEDLGSNRLGAKFGESIKRLESSPGFKFSFALQKFLTGLRPLHPNLANKISLPSNWQVAKEAFIAIGAGAVDVLVSLIESKAY